MQRKPNALKVARKRIHNRVGLDGLLDSDEQRILANGYMRKHEEIKRLKVKIAKLEENTSTRINRSYDQGVQDGISRAGVRPGFGDMGG